ncbi:3'-5' exonuclease [Amycolatopsis sp. MJM2582]|uniref:3'-5' exonuclease n=1 Tax=Amycolatopsis sp. MJM2582 TaxID=1427749 RepID=UPI001F1F372F|nr:3'-5' exonuclease [Amycolatopsis sp. MJM2582]
MHQESALLNVIDVEATCWDGQPPPGSVNEIIEIGLTVVDVLAGRRVSRHRVLIRPVRSTVSDFCTELTGLTQAEVERGVSFGEACRILVEEYGAGERPWTSWGEYDRRQFARQSHADGVAYPFGYPTERTHTNAKAVFAAAYGLRKKPGMDRALQIAGLPLEDAITAARTTRGTSPHSSLILWAVGHGRSRPQSPEQAVSLPRFSGHPLESRNFRDRRCTARFASGCSGGCPG